MKLIDVICCVLLAALVNVSAAAHAQSYPNKPIRMVVPWPAGGITDVIARAVGLHFAEALGQQVVIDNRPGAGSTLGAALVAKAVPDGYTLLMNDLGGHCISPSLYSNLPYDGVKDFAPVALVAGSPMVLVANPTLGVRTLPQLIELAKLKPLRKKTAKTAADAARTGSFRLPWA